jgi:hypothetical protein
MAVALSSLVALCRLTPVYDSDLADLVCAPDHGRIHDFGFTAGSGLSIEISPPQPNPLPYKSWSADKFLTIRKGGTGGALGCAEVDEAYVYDDVLRSEIDFSGLRLTLTLNPRAFDAYQAFIGTAPIHLLADYAAWGGALALRIPVEPFSFPELWRSLPPYTSPMRAAEVLRRIKAFAFDKFEVTKLYGSAGIKVTSDFVAQLTPDQMTDVLRLETN